MTDHFKMGCQHVETTAADDYGEWPCFNFATHRVTIPSMWTDSTRIMYFRYYCAEHIAEHRTDRGVRAVMELDRLV